MRTIGLRSGHLPEQIPASHRDLVQCPPVAALTTVTPQGYPQTSVVWCDFDGDCVRVNTMRGFAKERNMRANPRVTVLCYDPHQPLRYLEVRGRVVELTEAGAAEHLDQLASKYAGRPIHYFGDAIRPTSPRPRSRSCAGSDPTTWSRSTPRGRGQAMTASSAPETVGIPGSHLDLLSRPICGVLTTMGSDGQPQSSLVWVDWDGACVRVNTTLERQKGRNLVANPKVSLLVVDPDNPGRYLQLRGDAELVYEHALEHLDALTRSYTPHPAFYGDVYPLGQRWRETRVICRIHPRRITLDAVHA
jgi:PPOX class probable F420-dependent enzyme